MSRMMNNRNLATPSGQENRQVQIQNDENEAQCTAEYSELYDKQREF